MKTKLTPTYLIVATLVWCVVGSRASHTTAVPVAKNTNTAMVERRVHINPPGANDSRYAYVPFDVPPGAVRISVSYQYDRANNANAIDIGLFDARGTGSDADPHGF